MQRIIVLVALAVTLISCAKKDNVTDEPSMSTAIRANAEQAPAAGEEASVLLMERTRSVEEAGKYGVLLSALDIEPGAIKMYFGNLEIVEAWLERRPHPDVLRKAKEIGDAQSKHFVTSSILLCIRHRPLSVEEATYGGVWFTADQEWSGFSTADREVRRFRFWDGEPSDVLITVAQIHDLDLSGKKPKPTQGKGIVQTLRLKKKKA
jgi:hypothetical protein